MKYIKSAGCFSLFYVILYFILSTGMGIFITNTYLFTTLFYGILLIAAFLYLKICGDDTKKTLRMHKIHIGSFFLVILLAFTIRPVAGFITMIANLFFQDVTTNTMTQKVMQSLGLSVFTTAFLPGLVEEILFRGVLYSRLRKANPIKGILLSALLFGIAHMNFQQFSYAFFLGIVFGCLLEATDSIFATITAHMIFNGSSILLTYAISKVSLFGVNNLDTANTVTVSSIIASIPVALIGLILSIFLLVAIAYLTARLYKNMVSERYPTDLAKETCYKHLFLGCIYCLFSLFDHDGDYIIFSLNQKNFRICYSFHILKFFYSL